MSKERCEATKTLLKQAIQIMQSGATGSGRGISLAVTYAEDAVLRLDYHMREQGWVDTNGAKAASPPMPIANTKPATSTLKPAAAIPQLNTGLMHKPKTPSEEEIQEDLNLL